MKKIIGLVIYLLGIFGGFFALAELNIDLGSSFGDTSLMFLWYLTTFSVGTVLINSGNNSNNNNK